MAMHEVDLGSAANPSSMHAQGRLARTLIDEARSRVASAVECRPSEVVFTSGATESNNLAIEGVWEKHPERTLVTSAIEHPSVLGTIDALERRGAHTLRLPVSYSGRVDLERVAALASSGPCLFSLGWANAETGHLADIEGLGSALEGAEEGPMLHLDAAQALGRVTTTMAPGVNMLSLSAHKFGGPRGVGALIVRGEPLAPIMRGGPQERGLRPGTENLAAIVGMGLAIESAVGEMASESRRLSSLVEDLWRRLEKGIEGIVRLSPRGGLPNTLTVALPDSQAEVVVAGLDLLGFAVSTGSACAAASPEPSHVVSALDIDERLRRGVLRISMGAANSSTDVRALGETLVSVAGRASKAA
jgi:cysteine desulfurase